MIRAAVVPDEGASYPSRSVALVGALDTKAPEYGYVRDRLAAAGVDAVLVDTGVLGSPGLAPDVSRDEVAAAGESTIDELAAGRDRGTAVQAMARGAAAVVERLRADGRAHGVLILGGSNAGFTMSEVAATLPFGFPKLLVATIVAGDTRPYVGTSDLTMMYPVEDIAGLNSVSRPVLARAADAIAGMVSGPAVEPPRPGLRTLGMTMFGVTTACLTALAGAAERDGWEPHVFHATGVGGRTLEAMIRSGVFDAVADVTTTELADDLLGGVCSAGPERLTAAADAGIPQVVSVGALDMANFGPRATVPDRFDGRTTLEHNPVVTLLRTDAEECAELGRRLAAKVNRSTAPAEVHLPLRGVSQISVAGAPFSDPDADAALFDAIRAGLDDRIRLVEVDADINDPAFARSLHEGLRRVTTPIREDTPA